MDKVLMDRYKCCTVKKPPTAWFFNHWQLCVKGNWDSSQESWCFVALCTVLFFSRHSWSSSSQWSNLVPVHAVPEGQWGCDNCQWLSSVAEVSSSCNWLEEWIHWRSSFSTCQRSCRWHVLNEKETCSGGSSYNNDGAGPGEDSPQRPVHPLEIHGVIRLTQSYQILLWYLGPWIWGRCTRRCANDAWRKPTAA